MNCINCGMEIGGETICPFCGYDNIVMHKAVRISNSYYNRGLDMAQIRDMSGAVDMLERSLKFNKRNIDARNLLGLVYFETGEVVAALSEWVISKNIKPDDNVASEYIDKLRENQSRLENIQGTIRRYNRSLDLCRAGEEDMACVTLKKVIDANPKLIKAHYLLALIYMKREDYEKARKVLKKALPIDRTNPTALRFLNEIDMRTGKITDTVGLRRGIVKEKRGRFGRGKSAGDDYGINKGYTTLNWDDEENIISEPVVQPIAYRRLPAFAAILNMLVGIVLGALIIGMIAVPAARKSVRREADEQVKQYSQTIVTQSDYITRLENQIKDVNANVDSENSNYQNSEAMREATESLLDAYILYAGGKLSDAKTALDAIDESKLSEKCAAIYNNMITGIEATQKTTNRSNN